MKIEEFVIKFDTPHAVFEAGKPLSGQVILSLNKSIKLRSLKVFFVGESKTQWDEGSGKSKKRYKGKEVYLNHHMVLLEAGIQEGRMEHPSGEHSYPFSFVLPNTVPSSFEGRRGHVRYFCKATIDRPWKFDSHIKRIFTVIHHYDLNFEPSACVPIHSSQSREIEGCCCSEGGVDITLELNKTGYVPGEPIAFEIQVGNRSENVINRMQLFLIQIVTYTAYSDSIFSSGRPHKHPKEERFDLFNGTVNVIPNKTGTFKQSTLVPSLPPSVLDGCMIIDIQYHVMLKVHCGNSKVEILRKIIIGTIPIVEPTFHAPPQIQEPSAPTVDMLGYTQPPPQLQAPPSYEEALCPPPSYAECVFGRSDVRDENDDAHTSGDMSWAPAYPYYDWTLRPSQGLTGGQQPGVAQQVSSADDY